MGNNISEAIKIYLKENNMSMKTFSEQTGLSYNAIRNYCSGKSHPDFFTMMIIYQNTKLDLISLFDFLHDKNNDEFKKLLVDAKELHRNLGILIKLMENNI